MVSMASVANAAPAPIQQSIDTEEADDDDIAAAESDASDAAAEAAALKNNSNYEEASPRQDTMAKPASISNGEEEEEGPEKPENPEKEEKSREPNEASIDRNAKPASVPNHGSMVKPASVHPTKEDIEEGEVETKEDKDDVTEKEEKDDITEKEDKDEITEKDDVTEEGAEEMSEPAAGGETNEMESEDTVEAAENEDSFEAAEDVKIQPSMASASMHASGVSSHMANATGLSLSFAGPSGGLAHASSAGASHAARPSSGTNANKVQTSNGHVVPVKIGATLAAVAFVVYSLV